MEMMKEAGITSALCIVWEDTKMIQPANASHNDKK